MTRLFYDPFDGPLDLTKWNVRDLNQSWTSALCYIHPSAVTTAHSELCLSAFPQVMGTKKFVGGRVDTRDKFAIGPGMEVRVKARLPKNPACWPGIWDGDYDDAPWLQPQNIPPKQGGERDYAETGLEHGADGVTQTWIAHHHSGTPRYYLPLDVSVHHWYIMRDYGDHFTLALDDKETFTVWRKDQPYWPFDTAQPFKLILDLDLLRPITTPETMYVETVEVFSLPVSMPMPGPLPEPVPQPGGTMTILSPQNGQTVPLEADGRIMVKLDAGGVPVGVGQTHFARTIDGGATSYLYNLTDRPKLSPGTHTLKYQVVDATHLPLSSAQVIAVSVGIETATPMPTAKERASAKLKALGLLDDEVAATVNP